MRDWVECVPNFSEGRDAVLLERLGRTFAASDVDLLDTHSDPDHHRSVFTFVGSLPLIERAVTSAARIAVREMDLTRHRGTHPRIGVLDVVPIVPLADSCRDACVDAARHLGQRLWTEVGVPIYFYGEAACRPGRAPLESVRKLGFERLSSLVRLGKVLPDVGGPELHPTAGACCVGVRKLMVAFNVLIGGRDSKAARRIARAVRESSGGLPGVKALGMYLESAGLAQVSMNLTDLDETPAHVAFEAVKRKARKLGVPVLGSELVGLAPRCALGPHPERLRIRGFHSGVLLEKRLREVRGARTAGQPMP
jgi:glutamate formiminotransferase